VDPRRRAQRGIPARGDAQRAASLAGETLRTVFGVDDARSVIIRI
jgi:hypothetical protein